MTTSLSVYLGFSLKNSSEFSLRRRLRFGFSPLIPNKLADHFNTCSDGRPIGAGD